MDFRNSDLSGSDFTQSSMNKTIFGQIAVLKGHSDRVTSVAFSPDGKKIVRGSDDKTIRVWNAETGKEIIVPLKGHFDKVTSVAFSPDGKKIVSGSYD